MLNQPETKKESFTYKRDASGHLLCHICGYKPPSTPNRPHGNPSTLHYHLKKHEGAFPFVCSICDHGFLHKMSLETHMASQHPNHEKTKQVETFKCDIPGCEFESLTRGNLEIHKARKHYSEDVNRYMQVQEVEKKKVVNCTCCHKSFKSGTAFHYHILKCIQNHDLPLIAS
jgi:hypothetical protein